MHEIVRDEKDVLREDNRQLRCRVAWLEGKIEGMLEMWKLTKSGAR